MYTKESPATQKFPCLVEAPHNALGASIYIFSNDGLHFKAEIVDPQKSGPVGCFVTTLKIMSRHSCHICSPAFFMACSFLSQHSFMLSS